MSDQPEPAAADDVPAATQAPAPSAQKPEKPEKPAKPKRPLYARLLHLRHIAPNAWQRAVLGEGSFALAAVLVLADLVTAWTLIVLPLAVAALVKAHDLLAWLLGRPEVAPPAPKKPKAPEAVKSPEEPPAPDKPKAPRTRRNARTAPAPKGGAAGDRKS